MTAAAPSAGGYVRTADELPEGSLLRGRGRVWTLAAPATGARAVNFHLSALTAGSGPGPYHVHLASESAYYVLSGVGEFRLGRRTHPVGPGCAVHVPPGVGHAVTNTGDEELRMIGVYSPAEPDYTELDGAGPTGDHVDD